MDWRRRIFFLCGQVGMMSLARFLLMWNIRFGDHAGATPGDLALLDAALVGLAMFAFRIFDGVTDPFAGAISDGWVRRGRERRTLLWFAIALPPIGLALTFLPHHGLAMTLRWAFYLTGMFVFFVGYTLYAIPYWSLVEDYGGERADERRLLSTLLGAGLLLATAVTSLFSGAAISRFGYGKAAILFGLPAAVLMTLPYFAAPRREASGRPAVGASGAGARAGGASGGGAGPAGGASAHDGGPGLGDLWRRGLATLGHRRFLAFLLLFSGSQMAFTVVTSAAPYITGRLLGSADAEADVAKLLGPFLATALPCFIFAPALSRRFGWEKVAAAASVMLAVVYAGTAFLGSAVVGSPMTTAMIVFACGGPFAALILGLEGEAITDCARERGGEATSLYWGVFNLVVKGLNGLASWLTGLLTKLAREPGWEQRGVRAMSIMAGVLLLVGLAGYLLARERRAPAGDEGGAPTGAG